jgi:PST family polysaccharide transporter
VSSRQEIARKAVRGVFWSAAASYSNLVIGFGGAVVLARLLLPEEFGRFALAFAIAQIAGAFVSFSFPQALIQSRDWSPALGDTAWWLTLTQGGLTAALGGCAAILAYLRWGGGAASLVLILSLSTVPALLSGIYSAHMERDLTYGRLAWRQIAAQLLAVSAAIAAAAAGFGVWSLALRGLVGGVAAFALFRFRSRWKFGGAFRRPSARALFSFAGRFYFVRAIETAYSRLDRLLVGGFLGDAPLGFYDRARLFVEYGNKAAAPVSSYVSFSALSRLQDDPEARARAYGKVTYFLSRVSTLGAAAAFALPEELLTFLFGSQWAPAAPALRAMSALVLFRPMFEAAKTYHCAAGRIWRLAAIYAGELGVLAACLAASLSLGLGLRGAAVSVAAATALGYAALSVSAEGIPRYAWASGLVVPVAAGAAAAAVATFAKTLVPSGLTTLALGAAVACASYVVILLALDRKRLVTELTFLAKRIAGGRGQGAA